jgi:hypothetical protein
MLSFKFPPVLKGLCFFFFWGGSVAAGNMQSTAAVPKLVFWVQFSNIQINNSERLISFLQAWPETNLNAEESTIAFASIYWHGGTGVEIGQFRAGLHKYFSGVEVEQFTYAQYLELRKKKSNWKLALNFEDDEEYEDGKTKLTGLASLLPRLKVASKNKTIFLSYKNAHPLVQNALNAHMKNMFVGKFVDNENLFDEPLELVALETTTYEPYSGEIPKNDECWLLTFENNAAVEEALHIIGKPGENFHIFRFGSPLERQMAFIPEPNRMGYAIKVMNQIKSHFPSIQISVITLAELRTKRRNK